MSHPILGSVDSGLEFALNRSSEVDSRQYVFSYLIRCPEDAPADFPIPELERLRMGLFLQRRNPQAM
jgi:hypothetical protein